MCVTDCVGDADGLLCAVDYVAPTVDPNCPKPEGSTITPAVGEQLVVCSSFATYVVLFALLHLKMKKMYIVYIHSFIVFCSYGELIATLQLDMYKI